MADTILLSERRALMARIHGRDTQPEIVVRSLLYRLGFRYRLHAKNLPGRPDIVFRSRRKVIFIHGCFWHQHQGCRKGTIPQTRTEFWRRKLTGNVMRDRSTVEQLNRAGWAVLVVWECELNSPSDLEKRLIAFMANKNVGGRVQA